MKTVKVAGHVLSALRTRMRHEYEYGKRNITGEVKVLIHRLQTALKNVENNERVDAHLIANAVMITEAIARWNVAIETGPIVYALETEDA